MWVQNVDVNSDPRSEMMLVGSPCGRMTCCRNASASSGGVIVSEHGMKCAILVSRSTITHRELSSSVGGSPVMKSMDIESHGRFGGCRGLSSPKGACLIGLIRLQVSQWSTYRLIYFLWCGQ